MRNRQKKYPLISGEPCNIHNCVLCCIKTEMALSQDDLNRICGLGHNIDDFRVKTKHFSQLKNHRGRCIFLSGDRCVIYQHRPEGCRIYPLIFDESQGKPILDDICPYKREFCVKESDNKKLMELIEILISHYKSSFIR